MSEATKNRPEYRNIHVTDIVRYRMPLAALTSILHRISGGILFLLLPFLLWLLQQSLTSVSSFVTMKEVLSCWFAKLVILAASWAYLHHFCAGIRHLVLDTHVAATKVGARQTAAVVLVVSLLLTALVALKLFGVF